MPHTGPCREQWGFHTGTRFFLQDRHTAWRRSAPHYIAGETGAWAYIGDPGNLSTSAGITGSLQGGQQTPVPEPATMLLFGLGLLSVAGVSRKK